MEDIMKERPELKAHIELMAETAGCLWEKGWAECNGGNLSVDLSDILKEDESLGEDGPRLELGRAYPLLSGRCFLVTGAGRRFRDFAGDPGKNSRILRIGGDGGSYSIVGCGGGDPDFRPTSELPSHLRIHERFRKNDSPERAVLHTHPTELIALTHIPEYKDEGFLNRVLWGMLPEVKVAIPRGVGFAPYALPGSEELADATIAALDRGHRVVLWEMHGCLATGSDVMLAFDKIDILNKAAKIILLCLSAGHQPRGLTDAQLEELAEAFGVGGDF